MQYLPLVARLFLGGVFTLFGAQKVLGMAGEMPLPDAGAAFIGALSASGYFMPFLGLMELVGGLMVLTGFYRRLGLLLLAPIVANILLFHIFLAPGAGPTGMAVALLLAGLYLARQDKDAFSSILSAK